MEKKLKIKLRTVENGTNKATPKIEFPKTFSEVVKKAEEFIKISNPNETCQIVDEKNNKTISNQKEYEGLKSCYNDGELIKLHVTKINKKAKNENESFQADQLENTLNNNENGSINEEQLEKMKNDLKNIVHNNLENLENNLVETIFESIKSPLNESLIKKPKQNEIIHRGIECSFCNKKDIKGIRYKCINCENYNLCSKCESLKSHDLSHILIKIRNIIKNENELNSIIKNKHLKYKNIPINFEANIKNIDFEELNDNKKPETCKFIIELKNCGNETLKQGWSFKCLVDEEEDEEEDDADSDLKGSDYEGKDDLNPNDSCSMTLFVNELQIQLRSFIEIYKIYYKLINKDGVTLWRKDFEIYIPSEQKD